MTRTRRGPPGPLLTADEAAALLHLHVKRVQLLARQGHLPAVRHGRRWLFDRERLLRGNQARASRQGDGIDISARNQLSGHIRSIAGDGLMVEVTLAIDAQDVVAVITHSSAERLGLKPGIKAAAIVKSTEVMIARPRA